MVPIAVRTALASAEDGTCREVGVVALIRVAGFVDEGRSALRDALVVPHSQVQFDILRASAPGDRCAVAAE